MKLDDLIVVFKSDYSILITIQDANYSTGGPDAGNYKGMLETMQDANYSSWGMLETALDTNYIQVGMLGTAYNAY